MQVIVSRDGLEISGHANYAPKGQDIVCAAVCSLINAFVLSARKNIEAIEGEGYTKIKILKDDPATEAQYTMLVNGLRDISNEFPENVTIHDQAFMSLNGTIESSIETITR